MAASRSQYAACRLVEDRTLELETTAGREPFYNGVVVTEDTLLVINDIARNVQVYRRRDGKLISTHRLESDPKDVCLISKTEVVVCLEDSKIVILSLNSIDDVKRVKTLRVWTGFEYCHSVAKLNSDKLVVSGRKDNDMLYWCVVNLTDGRVDSTHKVCQGGIFGVSHLAVKNNTVYITCWTNDYTTKGVYAYDIFNPHTPKFLYQHRGFTPYRIMVDVRNFIYVSDWSSNSIHQLTDSGQLVTIHTVSSWPYEIFYDDQHGVLYTTSYRSNVITVYRLEYSHQSGIPIEILNMDDRSIQLFEEALKDGREAVYSIRIMVVGHIGVGKTTLVKRLLGEEVNISDRCSTEGIDVYVNCCDVSLLTCEWTKRTQDSEQDYRLQRIARVLNEQQSMKDKATREEQVIIPPQGETTHKSHEVARIAVDGEESEVLYVHSPQQDIGQDLSSTASQQEESPPALSQREPIQSETNMIAMLKLLQENVYKLKQDTDKTSPLTIWDFAGQYAFYTTHQTFLTRRAIYLLVSDVSKELADFVADECYFDSDGIMKCKVHELIEVWLSSIHSCATASEVSIPPVILVGTHVDKISQKQSSAQRKESETKSTTMEFTLPITSAPYATASKEQPRISTILGAGRKRKRIVEVTPAASMTGAHAVPAEDHLKKQKKLRQWTERKKRVKADVVTASSAVKPVGEMIVGVDERKGIHPEIHAICERYFKAIHIYLSDKPTRFHLVDEDFAIDNTVVDSKLEDLKRKIVEVASKQPYWGEKIPARWIPLEQELMKLRAAGVKVIPLSLLTELNRTGGIPISIDELDLFLRFHHDIGTVLYFSMDVLRNKIILDPKWLIDALKSLITADEMFILRNNKAVSEKWIEFKTKGKLTQELIDAIWTKEKNPDFHDNRDHLLLIMEQLNIISKPRSYSEDGKEIKYEDYYLAPCMLRQAMPKEIISPESDPEMDSTSILCFVCSGKFLPPPIFHRLVGACLTHWPIARKRSENQIYCGCCVFDIDHHHRLTLHFRNYIIFARVTRMGVKDKTLTSELCSKARKFIFENLSKILGNLGQSIQFEMHIKCAYTDADSLEGLIAVSLLQENEVVICHYHDKSHTLISRQLLQFWFPEEGKEDSLLRQNKMESRESSGLETDKEKEDGTDIRDQNMSQVHNVRPRAMNIPSKLYQSKGVPCSDPKLLCQILHKSQQAASSSQSTLEANCLSVGLELHDETPANGNCFFEAVSSQLQRLNCGVQKSPQQLRQEVAAFMRTNRVLHASEGTIHLDGFVYSETYDDYCTRMARDGEWADHVVVVAMARKLQMDICIVTSSPSSGPDDIIVWVFGQTGFKGMPILLGHIWESHYLSLQPIAPVVLLPDLAGHSTQAQTDVPTPDPTSDVVKAPASGSTSTTAVGLIQAPTTNTSPSTTTGSISSTTSCSKTSDIMQISISSLATIDVMQIPASESTTADTMQIPASESTTPNTMHIPASESTTANTMHIPASASTTADAMSVSTTASALSTINGVMQASTTGSAPSLTSITAEVMHPATSSSTTTDVMDASASGSTTSNVIPSTTSASIPSTTSSSPCPTSNPTTVVMHAPTSVSTITADIMQAPASGSIPSTTTGSTPCPTSTSMPTNVIQAPTSALTTTYVMQGPASGSTTNVMQTPTSSSTTAHVMQPPSVDDTDRFMHIACLLVNVGSRVLRRLLIHHSVTATCTLDQYLAKNRIAIDNLRKRKILNKSQMDILFPPGGSTNLGEYDITLLSALFTNIVPTISQQQLNMIQFLRDKRNEIFAHARAVMVNSGDYQTIWNDICTTLVALSKQCGDPDFENEILREIQGIQLSTVQGTSFLDTLQTHPRRIETLERLFQDFISNRSQESKETSDDSDS